MYAFDFRHDINLLDIRWTGLFTPEIAARYAHELNNAFWRSGFVPGYLLRVDMSGIRVQPSDSVMVVHNNMRNFPRASRIGMVTNSAIARQQILRLMKQPYLRIFDTRELALEWLLSPEEALA
ncbi:STAS/SEC14 domain-containing protein [Sphingomonas sanguinis]|uniref:STAS/SEC14 domain-containing protein n=1 Tax=Sphingomonas sanguinis TaxID=33051 RepID=A0ABU5LU16_9SPHN|nr:STAS/SEC14 domain-containing protein [Sphingomonas sanguinis]MDZ7283425.1 STAS/SEC14 domain-containing protein [Sphingomonas sanguinis]QXT37020.1 STAS/SEC14 domain-containing protein [Sphingomonas sanguinis]